MHRKTDKHYRYKIFLTEIWMVWVSLCLFFSLLLLFKYSTMNLFCFYNRKQTDFFQKERQRYSLVGFRVAENERWEGFSSLVEVEIVGVGERWSLNIDCLRCRTSVGRNQRLPGPISSSPGHRGLSVHWGLWWADTRRLQQGLCVCHCPTQRTEVPCLFWIRNVQMKDSKNIWVFPLFSFLQKNKL